ncbi:MAG: GNAT family N-acetyltransferase [Actinomycetota bacterium]
MSGWLSPPASARRDDGRRTIRPTVTCCWPASRSSARPRPTDDAPWGPLQVRERVGGMAIGGAGFKGPPDDQGVVEVGYGFAPSARGHGYATEAVRALCALAVARGAVAVIAETHVDNAASERVLERCGFAVTSRDAQMTFWRWEPTTGG